MQIDDLIESCKKNDRLAQKELYQRYAAKMMAVCMRYMKNREDAEEVVLTGMYKVLKNINQYSGIGHFEGWIKRIMVNEALMALRKNKLRFVEIDLAERIKSEEVNIIEEMQFSDVRALLDKLPMGYRTIFNLYVIEGYKHREISELLGISINTSKSQLILAKSKLRKMMKAKDKE